MTQRVLHICQWKRSFLHFSVFLSFHSKWLRKLEMKCRLKGLRWKDQLFQQRYVDFLVYLLKLTLCDTTVLDKKCSKVSTFLLTGDPANLPPQGSLSPPLSGQRCSVRSKNVPAVLQHCLLGRKGEVCWVNSDIQRCILNFNIQCGNFS